MRRIVLMAAVLAGCSNAPDKPRADPPQLVRFATVGGASQAGGVTAAGTVALRRETSLGFTTPGRIARLLVNEGDTVAAGQLLAALDQTTVGAGLASAQAERVRATAEYRRSVGLAEKGWVTRPRVESAEAAMRAAEANVRANGFSAANARIVAHGTGVVLARLAEPGQVVAAGTPVVVVGERASGYVLRLALSDRDAAKVTRGAPAEVRLDALGGASLAGQVVEVAGRADPATGTFLIEIGLPADPRLRSGQIGTARIVSGGVVGGTLAVPSQAVFAARAGEAFVYVLASDRVKLRRISVAETGDAGVTVTGGIARGERVATSGIDRLSDGAKVRIAP